jgi:hypothetical protein
MSKSIEPFTNYAPTADIGRIVFMNSVCKGWLPFTFHSAIKNFLKHRADFADKAILPSTRIEPTRSEGVEDTAWVKTMSIHYGCDVDIINNFLARLSDEVYPGASVSDPFWMIMAETDY